MHDAMVVAVSNIDVRIEGGGVGGGGDDGSEEPETQLTAEHTKLRLCIYLTIEWHLPAGKTNGIMPHRR